MMYLFGFWAVCVIVLLYLISWNVERIPGHVRLISSAVYDLSRAAEKLESSAQFIEDNLAETQDLVKEAINELKNITALLEAIERNSNHIP